MSRKIKIKLRGSSKTWFYFVIVARNGKTVAQSETYNNYNDAVRTIEMLRSGMVDSIAEDETQEAAAILAGQEPPDSKPKKRKARR